MPERPDFQAMGETTGDDEDAKARKHPVKWDVMPLAQEVEEG